MIEPIFEGARAACRRHPETKLMPNESECDDCKTLRRDLGLKPPFLVMCTRTHFGVKEGAQYQVIWVIRDGAKEHNENMIGYVFKSDKGHLDDHVYDPMAFVPIQFLEQEKKEDDIQKIIPGVMLG